MCGDDIEVPAMAWKYSPGGPAGDVVGRRRVAGQDLHAGRGDVGLEELAARPRDENAAITSPWPSPFDAVR